MLLAPVSVARTAALMLSPTQREARWMLMQSRELRRDYVRAVLDGPPQQHAQEIWMLRQDDDVRESFIRDVLAGGPPDTIEG